MNRIATTLMAGCATLLSACSTGDIGRRQPFLYEPGAPVRMGGGPTQGPIRERQIDLQETLKSALTSAGGAAPSGTLDDLVEAADRSPANLRIRNLVAGQWISASEANCVVYLQGLRSGQVTSRIGFDFLSAGLAGASAISTPASSAKLLAALSGFSTAEASSLDRNIFAQQGAEIIADAIDQLRAEDLEILKKHLKEDYATWSLPMAMRDLFAYHGDCSMLRGFSKLKNAVVAREQDIANIRKAAAAIQAKNGSGAQVAAVVAAFESSGVTGVSPASDATPVDDWDSDLKALIATASGCISAMTSTDPATFTCDAGAPKTWENKFKQLAKTAVDLHAEPLRIAAKGDVPKDLGKFNAEKAATVSEFVKNANDMMVGLAKRRVALADALAAIDPKTPASAVPPLVAAVSTLDVNLTAYPADADPVFFTALMTAKGVSGIASANGATVAAAALAAAKSSLADKSAT